MIHVHSIKNLLDAIKKHFYIKLSANGKIEFEYDSKAIEITEKFFDRLKEIELKSEIRYIKINKQ
jgi:hypothetical protein